MALFHSNSANIGLIANRKAGGERAHISAQSTYWTCHDTIRTQILNWSQMCRNRIVWTAVRFEPGQKPTVLCLVWETTPPRQSRSGFWPGVEPNRTEPNRTEPNRTEPNRTEPNRTEPNGQAKTGPLAGYPDLLLTLDIRELCAQVNLPSLLRQVWVMVHRVTTLIRVLPIPIRQVVPLLSHIRSHPPHRSHVHPSSFNLIHYSIIATQETVKSSLSISPCHDHELILSTAYTKYSMH